MRGCWLRWIVLFGLVASACGSPDGNGGAAGGGGGSGGVSGSGGSGGGPMGGQVGPTGGTVDRLAFAVWGDSRPANLNDDASYPVAVVRGIAERANRTPAEFAVATGDYMFASTPSSVATQVSKLLGAEEAFTKPIFRTMGNHECTGATASNCPNATETYNVRAFMMQLVPFTQKPYYALTIHTEMGDAKFVFIAANAWDSTQQAWLEMQLGQPTQYTFVVRHEPPGNTEAPGAAPSDAIIAAHPPTVAFYGHTHTYRRLAANQVISGNGGAPMSYGYPGLVYVEQRPDGNVALQEIRQDTGTVTESWAVTPAGALTQ